MAIAFIASAANTWLVVSNSVVAVSNGTIIPLENPLLGWLSVAIAVISIIYGIIFVVESQILGSLKKLMGSIR